jgi:Uma2 family endonuclease
MSVQEIQSPVEAENLPLITGKELAEMEDIGPCELVEGRIIKMSPVKMPHGKYEMRFARYLGNYVEEHNLGEVNGGEVGIYTRRDPDTVRGADLLFISHARVAKATPGGFLDVAPELVVEIMSPSDRWGTVQKKLREYFEIGVMVVLVIEPEEQVVSVYRSPTEIRELSIHDALTLEDILPGFRLPLADLFA